MVVGVGDDGWPGLTEEARGVLRDAPLIAGSARHLALMPDLPGRRVSLPSPLLPQLDDLVAANPGLCLLASGDPMLHGLGATLARRLGAGRLRVLPAVSSVALACSRLGWGGHHADGRAAGGGGVGGPAGGVVGGPGVLAAGRGRAGGRRRVAVFPPGRGDPARCPA